MIQYIVANGMSHYCIEIQSLDFIHFWHVNLKFLNDVYFIELIEEYKVKTENMAQLSVIHAREITLADLKVKEWCLEHTV